MTICSVNGCYQMAELEREERLKKAKIHRLKKNDFPDDRLKTGKQGDYIGHYFPTRKVNGKCFFHNRFIETEAI